MIMIWHKKLLVYIFIIFSSISISEARVYLVAVGVADYPGEKNDLYLPINDAKAIISLYQANEQVTYCQLINQDATPKKIIAAMKIFSLAQPNDIVVFYYSGHGYTGGFAVYDGYLSYEEMRLAMTKSKCNNKIIFADACFSGGLGNASKSSKKVLKQIKETNVMLFLSSRGDEYSWQSSILKNAYFTHYLQKGLRGNADIDRNKIITAKEIFEYVYQNVVAVSNNQQHPVMWGHFSNKMPVIRWDKNDYIKRR